VRAYPVGDGPRDQGQLNLLARLRAVLPDGVRTSTEVPIGPLDDLRAWDMVIRCIDGDVAVEAETRLRDMQALERRLALKQRDGGIDRLVLVMGDTAHNRAVLRAAREGLRAGFPLDTRMALAALRAGRRPRANAIIVV